MIELGLLGEGRSDKDMGLILAPFPPRLTLSCCFMGIANTQMDREMDEQMDGRKDG